MAEALITIALRSNAQDLSTASRQVTNATEGLGRIIVDDIALAAQKKMVAEHRRKLVKDVRAAIHMEVARMAISIGRTIALADKYSGPHGQMTFVGNMSGTAMAMRAKSGFEQRFNRQSTGLRWSKRDPKYLRAKAARGGAARWWEETGKLGDSLENPSIYEDALGKVNVLYFAARPKQDMVGATRNTRSGKRGRSPHEIQVGRLEVVVFGRITPRMIPAIGRVGQNPKFAAPTDNGPGISALFDDPIKGPLLGKQAKRRYALEPFVAFYLTRAIPNAIWRRIEAEASPVVWADRR